MSFPDAPAAHPSVRAPTRNAYAQAMFDAKAKGFHVPDVELVWFDRVDIAAGCPLSAAKLFAYEGH